jgi:hypothetical protein
MFWGIGRALEQASRSTRLWQVWIIIVLIAASSVPILASQRLAHPIDDAYITLTYARSLSEGRGFTFGEFVDKPSLGTTTPLYAALLAVASRLLPFADIPQLAVALSVVAWLATAWLWAWQGPALGLSRLESLCVALLLLFETSFWISALGMETRLFCFLLSLSLVVYFRGWVFLGWLARRVVVLNTWRRLFDVCRARLLSGVVGRDKAPVADQQASATGCRRLDRFGSLGDLHLVHIRLVASEYTGSQSRSSEYREPFLILAFCGLHVDRQVVVSRGVGREFLAGDCDPGAYGRNFRIP